MFQSYCFHCCRVPFCVCTSLAFEASTALVGLCTDCSRLQKFVDVFHYSVQDSHISHSALYILSIYTEYYFRKLPYCLGSFNRHARSMIGRHLKIRYPQKYGVYSLSFSHCATVCNTLKDVLIFRLIFQHLESWLPISYCQMLGIQTAWDSFPFHFNSETGQRSPFFVPVPHPLGLPTRFRLAPELVQ